jgi:hypothetical protein
MTIPIFLCDSDKFPAMILTILLFSVTGILGSLSEIKGELQSLELVEEEGEEEVEAVDVVAASGKAEVLSAGPDLVEVELSLASEVDEQRGAEILDLVDIGAGNVEVEVDSSQNIL